MDARWGEIEAEVTNLSHQLHLLHIINPEVRVHFSVLDSPGVV